MRPEDEHDPLPAGRFSAWLADTVDPSRPDMDVPCGTCTACCRASYFIHVAPDEHDTLRHIPKRLLFPAPGRPKGHKLLGFDERGHCPMLTDGGCSIYDHRPRTCRTYDCRIFTAAGVSPDEDGKTDIAARTRQWRFDVASEPSAVTDFQAVQRAAAFLAEHRSACFPDGGGPTTAGDRAALAIKIHRVFLATGDPDPSAVRSALEAG